MPPRRRRPTRGPVRVSGRRRPTWATIDSAILSPASGATITPIDVISDLEVSGVGVVGATVVRTHLKIDCSSPTSDTHPGLRFGLIVWDSTAGLPDPSADKEDDWYMWDVLSPALSRQAILVGTSILYGKTYDIRSMRKLHQLHDKPFFTLHNSGSTTLSVVVTIRTLLALP